MALSPPPGGLGDPLRRLRNRTKQTAKVTVHVAPGDELAVSDDVAAQLEAATTAFGPAGADGPVKDATATPSDVAAEAVPKPGGRRPRKS